jgi:alpha-L-fucosidase
VPRPPILRALIVCALLALNLGAAQGPSFAVITDTHIGSGIAAADDLAAVVASINARRDIGFVVHTGDITEKGRDAEFAESKRLLDRLSVPWFIVPGNHDAHWIGRGLAGYRAAFKDERFFFDRDGRACIGLSTGEFGHFSPEDISFLAGSLEKVQADEPVFVFIHYPPASVDNWSLAHNLLRLRRTTIICGHGHRTQILGPSGIPAVMARAAVSRAQAEAWGYVIFRDKEVALAVDEVTGLNESSPRGWIDARSRTVTLEMKDKSFEERAASILWRADLNTTLVSAPVVTANEIILQTLGGRLTVYDLSGRTLWSYNAGESLISRPAVRGGALFIASAAGRVSKLELKTGRLLAAASIGERATSDLAVMELPPGRFSLLIGTTSGRLFCLDGESLRTLWASASASDMIQTRPLVTGSAIVFGAWDARVHALDAADGREIWKWTENDNFYYSPAGCVPATDGKRVFVCSPDGFVSAVDVASGKTAWRTKCASWESLSLTADKKNVLVKSRVDEFWILNAETGRPLLTIAPAHGAGDLIPCEPLFWKSSVIFGGQNGNIYRIGLDGPAEIVLGLGPAAILSIQSPADGVFIAADVDGRVAAFRLDPSPRNFALIEPGEPIDSIVRKAANVVPAERQMAWQELEVVAFAHFGMNTFTDREWGQGTEDPALFNPTAFDARQWVRAIKAAGMKQLIVTAKHHDGFCLWPSRLTSHSVKSSPWRSGKGDVVAEVAAACREAGLGFGVYLSPWDRHEPSFGDSPRYNEFFRGQLRELLTGYGRVDEVWFDGANGEGPNGKRQVYDWPSFYAVIRELQPQAVIAIMGPDVRWVGTESGYGRETEWSVLPAALSDPARVADAAQKFPLDGAFTPGDQTLPDLGSRSKLASARALIWYPAETDVSIRPGWFYHAKEDARVKTPEKLVDIYFSSVGRNGVLLLNIPPDRRGLIHENDAAALAGMRAILDETFRTNLAAGAKIRASNTRKSFDPVAILDGGGGPGPSPGVMFRRTRPWIKAAGEWRAEGSSLDADPATYWTTAEGVETARFDLEFSEPRTFDRALLQENIRLGQRIERFALEWWDGTDWLQFSQGATVGYKRILAFPVVTAKRIRLSISESRTSPTLSSFGLYKSPAGR